MPMFRFVTPCQRSGFQINAHRPRNQSDLRQIRNQQDENGFAAPLDERARIAHNIGPPDGLASAGMPWIVSHAALPRRWNCNRCFCLLNSVPQQTNRERFQAHLLRAPVCSLRRPFISPTSALRKQDDSHRPPFHCGKAS